MESSKSVPKYTTMGSIVKPNPTPLQPPARRGRAIKWPPQPDFGLAASPVSGLSFGNDPRSPSSAEIQPLHYSPLQQNTDRAISPTFDHSYRNNPPMSLASILSAHDACRGKHNDTSMSNQSTRSEEDDVENDALKHLKHMSTKTLTNLASYENPKQKMAQRILSDARAAPLHSTQREPDQVSVNRILQSDGAGDRDARMTRYNSILSKGLGAPHPLTAGPPGLRQHRSSTLEHAAATRQSSSVTIDAILAQKESRFSASTEYNQSAARDLNSQQARPIPTVQEALNNDYCPNAKVLDTLPPDEARKYYDKGFLPANFNYQTRSASTLTASWVHSDQQTRIFHTDDVLLAHNIEIDALWSEGTAMLNKSMDQAIAERKHRDFGRAIGVELHEPKLTQKIVSPKLAIEDANRMTTSEHSEHLLNMAFQTLINLETFTK